MDGWNVKSAVYAGGWVLTIRSEDYVWDRYRRVIELRRRADDAVAYEIVRGDSDDENAAIARCAERLNMPGGVLAEMIVRKTLGPVEEA